MPRFTHRTTANRPFDETRGGSSRSSRPASGLTFSSRRLAVILFTAAVLAQSGCNSVYRRILVRSDPPGARVLLDGQEVGYTPVGIPFTWYGTRQLTLIKPGFETRTECVTISTPWYEVFPLDFVSDNLLPYHVADRHEVNWQLRPQTVVPLEQLEERAESLRSEAHLSK